MQLKTIIITGTPGTGKTSIAKKLCNKFNYKYIDVNNIIKKYKISKGYDKKCKTKIVDIQKLNKALISEIKKIKKNITKKVNGVIIDSHLSHYLPYKYADLCIVTKCNLKALKIRLKKRGYSKNKIRENLDAEIFDICYMEALENGHNILVMNTDKNPKMQKIIKAMKSSDLYVVQ